MGKETLCRIEGKWVSISLNNTSFVNVYAIYLPVKWKMVCSFVSCKDGEILITDLKTPVPAGVSTETQSYLCISQRNVKSKDGLFTPMSKL